jgi:ABC-type transporter Mla subunit MlaD
VTLGTVGLVAAFVVVFVLGWMLGYGSGHSKGKVEVLEADLEETGSNEGEGQ